MLKEALSRLGKNTLIYGIGGVLSRFVSFLLLPFFTEVLTKKEYGIFALIMLLTVGLNGLLTLGTGNSLGVLYFREDSLEKRPTLIWSNFILLVVNGIFWSIITWFLAPFLSSLMFQSPEYSELIKLAMLTSILVAATDTWLSYLRMEEMASKYLCLTLSFTLLQIALSAVLVLNFNMGVLGLVRAGTITAIINLIVSWFFVGRKIAFSFDSSLIFQLTKVGFPSIFGLLAFLVIDYADRQMIERLLGLDELGIYSIGYSFGMVILVFMSAFATSWPPFSNSYIKKPMEAQKVFGKVLTYYLYVFGALTIPFFAFAKPVLFVMTAEKFHEAWVVVGLVAAAYGLKGCYLIFLPGIYFAKKLKYQSMIEWSAALLNIALNLLMIELYGIKGAAISTFISYLLLPFLAWIIGRKYLVVAYEWRRVLLACLTICVASYASFEISRALDNNFQLLFSGLLIFTIFLVIVYFFLLNPEERKFLKCYIPF